MLWTVFLEIWIALLVALAGWLAWLWAARSGQFDDMEGPKHRMLDDDVPGAKGPDRGNGV